MSETVSLLPQSALMTALDSDRDLMRWAAHSAWMSRGGDAPDLLRVTGEEVHVEPPAETVHHPLLEGVLLLVGAHLPLDVAQHDAHGLVETDLPQRVERLQRVVEVASAVVDAAEARPAKELVPEHLAPHLLDLGHLREEAVPPDVEAEPLVGLGPRDAAEVGTALQHRYGRNRIDPLQLECGRQTCRSSADDHRVTPGILMHRTLPQAVARAEDGVASSALRK
jgi:hypothetical protein